MWLIMTNWTPEMIELEKVANKLTREKNELIEWLEECRKEANDAVPKNGAIVYYHAMNDILNKLKGDDSN